MHLPSLGYRSIFYRFNISCLTYQADERSIVRLNSVPGQATVRYAKDARSLGATQGPPLPAMVQDMGMVDRISV